MYGYIQRNLTYLQKIYTSNLSFKLKKNFGGICQMPVSEQLN